MKKIVIAVLSIVVIVAFIIFGYFYTVWAKGNNQEQEIINIAHKKVPALEKIDDIDYFTGNEQYYFIFGRDKNDLPMLIWINEKGSNYIYLFEYVTKDEIKKKGLAIAPDINIKRINAGFDHNNDLIYEVLYEDTDGRLGYQFFYLKTGEFITMYKLGKVRD